MITVGPGRLDERVCIYEQDPAHPDGELFVWGSELCRPKQAGETQAVLDAIATGALVRVATPTAPVQVEQPSAAPEPPASETSSSKKG